MALRWGVQTRAKDREVLDRTLMGHDLYFLDRRPSREDLSRLFFGGKMPKTLREFNNCPVESFERMDRALFWAEGSFYHGLAK